MYFGLGYIARLKNNDDFDDETIWMVNGGSLFAGKTMVPASIGVVRGKLKNKISSEDTPYVKDLFFNSNDWTTEKAENWLKENKIKYEDIAKTQNKEDKTMKINNEEIAGFIRPGFVSDSIQQYLDGSVTELPNQIQILPLVDYEHPEGGPVHITPQILLMMKNNFDKLGDYVVIDYEHSSLRSIIAAGAAWITGLEIRNGESGLWADVQWTPNAAQRIIDKEYRYGSPVFDIVKENGVVVDAVLHSHAITNTPVIKGMSPLFNSNKYFKQNTNDNLMNSKKGEEMVLDDLKKVYGLDAEATEETVMECVNSDRKSIEDMDTDKEKEGVKDGIKDTEIESLKAENSKLLNSRDVVLNALGVKSDDAEKDKDLIPDTIKNNFVNKSDFDVLVNSFKDYKTGVESEELGRIVNSAMADGKISASQKEWAEDLGKTNIDSLKSYLVNAHVVVPVGKLTGNLEQGQDKSGATYLNSLVSKHMNENKVTYKEALDSVCAENPDLAKNAID